MPELQPYRPSRVAVEEQSIRGRRVAVDAELVRIERAGKLVSKAEPVDEGRGIVSVRFRRIVDLEHAAPARQGRHPGWTIGILLAASVLVVSLAAAVLMLVAALAAAATLLIGLAVVVGAVVIVPRMLGGGGSYTQIMNIHR